MKRILARGLPWVSLVLEVAALVGPGVESPGEVGTGAKAGHCCNNVRCRSQVHDGPFVGEPRRHEGDVGGRVRVRAVLEGTNPSFYGEGS